MTGIGTSLVFYLKYFAEMERLYGEEAGLPEIDNRPDAEAIGKQVSTVGKQAWTEAADLLLECVAGFRTRLDASGLVTLKVSRRETIERNWQVTFDVYAARVKKPAGVARQIGVYVDPAGIVPWVWSRGGRLAEDRICALLPGVACRRAKQLDWDGGSVALPTVKIPWETAKDFHVEKAPLIKEVDQVLRAITPKFLAGFLED